MKKWIFSAVLTGCLLLLTAAVPVQAQVLGTTVRVAIPFDFIVGRKTLPAGNYEIRRVSDSPESLAIRNTNDNHDRVAFNTESTEARTIANKGEVVFHRYGDTYFLSGIFAGGEQTGEEVVPSRSERSLRRELMASNRAEGAEPEIVALAAD